MSENPFETEMRLYALELMLTSLLAAQHIQTGNAEKSLLDIREKFREKTRRNPLPGFDPVTSDMASAELEAAFERLHRMQAGFLGIKMPKENP